MSRRSYKDLIGKRIEWEYAHDHNRGSYFVRKGFVEDVKGRNMWVDGDVMWGPDLNNIRVLGDKQEDVL